jgi:hypothetical protein
MEFPNFVHPINKPVMKYFSTVLLVIISCIISASLFSQQVEDEWKSVDNLVKQGMTATALERVEAIYENAMADEDHVEMIKALLYKSKLRSDYQEEFLEKTIAEVKAAAISAPQPASQVLHSILAELYWRYYQMNRYRFLERTPTSTAPSEDIKTWDLQTLFDRTGSEYLASMENKDLLQQTPVGDFNMILVEEKGSDQFRPTLYDFLAHRALAFFMNEEASVTRAEWQPELAGNNWFAPAEEFVLLIFPENISSNNTRHALEIFRELLAFHQEDEDKAALIDADLKRIEFVRSASIAQNRDEAYEKALIAMERAYKGHPLGTEVSHNLARVYYEEGMLYDPHQNQEPRMLLKRAHEIAAEAVERFPESFGAMQCRQLLQSITEKDITITMDYGQLPGQPMLGYLEHRNVSEVWFRIVKVDSETDRNLRQRNRNEELIRYYLNQPAVREWNVELPGSGDYQTHTAQVDLGALPLGYYILLAAESEKFDLAGPMAFNNFWVTELSFINQSLDDGTLELYVLDRESGMPVENATVRSFVREYDYTTRQYSMRQVERRETDRDGDLKLSPQGERSRSVYLSFSLEQDTFITQNYFYQYAAGDSREPDVNTWFFTDRSIYRPGQTVYFKGIMLKGKTNDYEVVKEAPTTVTFYDVNGQKIAEQELSTNEYGSFQGSFTAPTATLTGQMRISNNSGNAFVSVEEYRRPSFEVTMNPLEGAYRLNEPVTVTGTVKGYSGIMVDNAVVKFRVVRKIRFPFRMGRWYWPFPDRTEVEITSGETISDENGAFSLTFNAIPDPKVEKRFNPVFYYEVKIEATDITGETRIARESVAIGYKSMFIEASVPGNMDLENLTAIPFSTTNLNGSKIDAEGEIEVYRLEVPETIYRSRNWPRPDQFLIEREDFRERFPADAFDNETDPYSWELQQKVFSRAFNSTADSLIDLKEGSKLKPGKYLLKIEGTDEYGETVTFERVFTLFSSDSKQMPVPSAGWFHPVKSTAQPGGNAKLYLGSSAGIRVLYQLQQGRQVILNEWLELDDEVKEITIPIEESYRGNVTASFSYVYRNRSYQFSELIKVERSDKQLDIVLSSFRSDLYPGSGEVWTVKVRDDEGDAAMAELLASMYDASLDQIKGHEWMFRLYSSFGLSGSWDVQNAFTVQDSRFWGQKQNYFPLSPRAYDRLNWFGFNNYGGAFSQEPMMQGRVMKMADMEVAEEGAKGMPEEAGQQADQQAEEPAEESEEGPNAPIRRNFNETAFFFPQLKTDDKGEVMLSFTVPESLTEWRFMALAHNGKMQTGMIEKSLVTKKELMVIPNPPRFVREGDQLNFSAKLTTLSEAMNGFVTLELLDPFTMEVISDDFGLAKPTREFQVGKGASTLVSWQMDVPAGMGLFAYRIMAKSQNFNDGEERTIPVLPSRMLVTETLPLAVSGAGKKTFSFEGLKKSDDSETLENYRLTLQFSSNPAWYAVLALPYLREGRYDNAENIFSRFYANAISSHIATSDPKIRAVYEQWKMQGDDVFESQLSMNEELKGILLDESPWVMDALREKENRQNIAILFDGNRMRYEAAQNLKKLRELQLSSGAWPWFNGMRENRYITQHIVAGIGKMERLNLSQFNENTTLLNLARRAIYWMDQEVVEDLNRIKSNNEDYKETDHLSSIQIHYLYARSFFHDQLEVRGDSKEAFDYFVEQAKSYWLKKGRYEQGLISLALQRIGETETAAKIIASLKDNSLYNEEMGMYWRDLSGYNWNEAAIERQALMIEAFDEITDDSESVERMKIWLLKQKQTQAWETSKATADAVYALLLRGTDLLADDTPVTVELGYEKVDPLNMDDIFTQAGTGFFETSWNASEIKPEMGDINVTKTTGGIAWGGVFWQYYEDLDKIGKSSGPLSIEKEIYVERNTLAGPVLIPVDDQTKIQLGDQVVSRITIRADRDFEFIHVKDMRAASLEPENMLSGYRWQDRLGYYESPKDASTNFFMDYLRKGTYVLEYRTFATRSGTFTNGITSIQCLYAPEFGAHSEGVKVVVE